jgi:hypothetical protein
MFYVIAAGSPAPVYQWLSNGVPIPAQTGPVLTVENVISNQPQSYSVIVSNSGGAVQSASATLSVNEADPVPFLGSLASTNASQMPFTLRGEPGRWYKFQVGWDLVNWFDIGFGQSTNQISVFSVRNFSPDQQFVWASLNFQTDACVARLRALQAALSLLVADRKMKPMAPYTMNDLLPYFPAGLPVCPQNGVYVPGSTVTNQPHCSLESARGHTLGN